MAEIEPGADTVMYRSSAPVRVRSYTRTEREALESILHSRVDPSVFEGEGAPDPFFFAVEASNGRIDSYFTRMAKSSLRNYADDANDPGVQFQVSHNGASMLGGGEVGFGRSLQGKFQSRGENPATVIDFYTIPGLTCGNMTSDQFITGARAGIYSDVSVGFTPGAFICNICGGDMLKRWELDWDDPDRCSHYPGFTYEIEKTRGKTEKILCIADVEAAHLNEVSTVYDGATPGAGILAVDMGRIAASRGKLDPLDHQLLENIYRVRIDLPERVHALGGITMPELNKIVPDSETATRTVAEAVEENPSPASAEGEETVVRLVGATATTEPVAPPEVQPMERLRRKYEGKLEIVGSDPYRTIELLADMCLEQHGRIQGLEKDAEYGRQAHEEVLSELDVAVVRVFGADAAEEKKKKYRLMASVVDISGIRELISDLESKAGERFQAGRLTKDVTESEGKVEETPADGSRRLRGKTPAHLVG